MSANYRNPNFLLPNELNQSINPDLSGLGDRHSLYSMEFDSNNSSYIGCGVISELVSTTKFSVSGWFYFDSVANSKTLFSYGGNTGTFQFSMTVQTHANGNLIFVIANATNDSGGNYIQTNLAPVLTTSTWYHIVCTYDGSQADNTDKAKIYINGTEVAYATGAGTIPETTSTSTGPFNIGKWELSGGNDRYFDGKIDEVAVFNTTLNLSQVQALADSKNSPVNPMALSVKPIAYYPLGEQARNTGYLSGGSDVSGSEWQFPNQSIQSTVVNFENSGAPSSSQTGGRIDLGSDINLGTQHTISLWIKLDPPNPAPNNAFTILGSDYTPNKYTLFLQGSSIYYKPINAANNQFALWTIPNTSSVFDSSWHNIILNRDGSTLSLYLDGNQITLTSNSVTTGQASIDTIGANHPGISTSYYLNGKLSNVVIWNSDQSSEKDNIYNNGSPATSYTNTPTAWYKLNAANSSYAPYNANFNSALSFDGQNDYMTFSNFNSLNGLNTFSISFWANFNTVALNDTLLMHNFLSGIRVLTANYKMTFKWLSSDGTNVQVQSNNVITPSNFWTHYACTYDNTDFKLYENGVLVKTTNQPSKTYKSDSGQNLLIGRYWYSLTSLFDGLLSNLSIFNTALDAPAISTLYNNGTPEISISGTPENWWKLNAGGTTITDYGSGGNNGTNNGATLVSSPVAVEQWNFTDSAGSNDGSSTTLPISALVRSDLQFESPYSNFSLDFDGTNYIDCGDNLNFQTADSFSASVWMKPTIVNVTQVVLGKNKNVSPFNGYTIQVHSSGTVKAQLGASVSSYLKVEAAISAGVWTHVLFTYDGTATNAGFKLYVNGQPTGNYAGTLSGNISNNASFSIGRRDNAGYSFNGSLDEIAVWDKVLTPAQASQVYNNGLAADLTSLSPVSWWRLGEDAYFVNNNITIPNQIAGAPNGTGSGTQTSMLVADAPGSYGSGSGVNLGIFDRVGEAPGISPINVGNSQSYNMIPDDRHVYVPGYTPAMVDNAASMNFDGVNDTFSFKNEWFAPTTPLNATDGNHVGSVSMWFNLSNVTQFDYMLGLNTRFSGPYLRIAFDTNGNFGTNRNLRVVLNASDNAGGEVLGQVLLYDNTSTSYGGTGITWQPDTWYHIAVVYDKNATNRMIIYLDGVPFPVPNTNGNITNGARLIGTMPYSLPYTATSSTAGNKCNIGSYYDGYGFFAGSIDEVALFDYALTPKQIREDIYNASKEIGGVKKTADLNNNSNLTAPVAWYRMGD